MKIRPCKDDVYVNVFGVLPLTLLLVIMGSYRCDWNPFMSFLHVLIFLLACLMVTPYCIYSGRSFVLDARGWTISIGKYQKTYSWDEITVSYCKNDHGISVGDWPRPGILLTASPLKKPSRLTAMPACIQHHPIISVFLGFREDNADYKTVKVICEGYVVEKEELLAFFEENHIEIEDGYLIK